MVVREKNNSFLRRIRLAELALEFALHGESLGVSLAVYDLSEVTLHQVVSGELLTFGGLILNTAIVGGTPDGTLVLLPHPISI